MHMVEFMDSLLMKFSTLFGWIQNIYFTTQNKIRCELVLKAYSFGKTDDRPEKLLALNLEVAEKEKNGESVIGSWAPDNVPKG